MDKLDIELVKQVIEYNPETGEFKNKKTSKALVPNINTGLIGVNAKDLGIKFKIKPEKLAWFMMYGTIPSGRKRILHKNLDSSDNRLCNLGIVTAKELRQIREAYSNLKEYLRIVPHGEDQFSYVLHWKSGGLHMREVVQDLVVARRKLRRLQLKNAKILSKFCVFD